MVLFFIVWGTKVRQKTLGCRVDFCPGCLRRTTFDVKTVEQASHLYYIPGPYREVARYCECDLCATKTEAPLQISYVRPVEVSQLTIDQLAERTNPVLTREREEEIRAELCDKHGEGALKQAAVQSFLANLVPELKQAEDLGVGSLVVLVLGIVLAVFGFIWRVEAGIAAVALAVIGFLGFYWWQYHWRGYRKLSPRIRKFLGDLPCQWSDLTQELDALAQRERAFRKLRRHLSPHRYEQLAGEAAGLSRSAAGSF
ncbi:MAG: hypothetical protein AB7U73_23665 [Pirellulales bacterium]